MKIYNCIIFIFVFAVFSAEAQDASNLDSLINIYERSYRVELNESDFEFIEKVLTDVDHKDCSKLIDTLSTSNISNSIVEKLIRKSISEGNCLNEFLDNIEFNKLGYNNDDFESDYPILTAIKRDTKTLELIYNHLEKSEYLEKCDLLYQAHRKKIRFLQDFLIDRELGEIKISCKAANVTLISKMKI